MSRGVAQNLLTELDTSKPSVGVIYAKFILAPEVISIDYDIFDKVTLKARLKNKTVNTTLKIYSIKTDVSYDRDQPEIITLELMNFNRGAFAQIISPLHAGNATDRSLNVSSNNTFVQDNVNPAGGQSVIAAAQNSSVESSIIGNTYGTFSPSLIMPAQDVTGVHIWFSVKLIVGGTVSRNNEAFFRITDGTNFYPSSGAPVSMFYTDTASATTLGMLHVFIPGNVNGKTLTIQATIGSGATGTVTIVIRPTYYTISNL